MFESTSVTDNARLLTRGKPLPGHRGVPLFGSMVSLGRAPLHITAMKMVNTYGSVFQIRLGNRPVVFLYGYNAIYKALVRQPVVFAGRPDLFSLSLYNSLTPGKSTILFSSYDERWRLHRKIAESSLRHFTAGKQIVFVEVIVSEEADFVSLTSPTFMHSSWAWLRDTSADRNAPGSEKDILDHIVTTSQQQYGLQKLERVGVTENMLLGTVIEFVGAGFDTVSATLEWCIIYMAAYPDVQAVVQRELDSVAGRDRLPTWDYRNRLPLTRSCLLEIQRHATAIPFSIPHCTTSDTVLDDMFIQKDTTVFVNLYFAHFYPTIWDEPESFRPRRFIAADGVNLDSDLTNYVFLFGLGRRRCVGAELAQIEVFLFFSILLHKFSFGSDVGDTINLEPTDGISRRPKEFKF
ncbi:LOW QUALITY PROTEIN: cytochrome P450 1A1-like [Diadema setosum]|uniref:LOW QUALITY PROTEIN: cytochrome P450 1A1-like n=1 Tax=Diadema setosum TaxID=31175 RepID=UPI003B3A7F09